MSGLKLPMACGEVTLLELGKVRSTKRGSRRAALGLQRLRWLGATCVRVSCSELSGSLWQLDPAAPGSHDEDYVYPIGFRTCRKHASAANPGSKCLYHSEIVAGPQGAPQFKVTCADMSEHSFEDSTPNVRVIRCKARKGCWRRVTLVTRTRRVQRMQLSMHSTLQSALAYVCCHYFTHKIHS